HQCFQIRRIAFGSHLGLECAAIGGVFVAVDGVTHLPQVTSQLVLSFPLDSYSRQRKSHSGQDDQNRRRHDQLDQSESARFWGRNIFWNCRSEEHTSEL